MMFGKRICAALLCAVMAFGTAAPAFAENTASVTREYEASAVKWDGKSALKSGKSYVITKDITVSKAITVPSGTTLTVKNNSTLTVKSTGGITVKGSLVVNKGSTLYLNGKATVEKGKKLTTYGTLKFGSKANLSIYGTLYVKSTGKVTGAPKKVDIKSSGKVSLTGKNSSAKLTEAINRKAIGDMLDKFFTKCFVDGKLYDALKAVYPAAYLEKLDKALSASGSSLKDFCALTQTALSEEAEKDVVMSQFYKNKNAAVDVIITKLTACTKSLTAEEKAAAKEICGGADKAYTVTGVMSLSINDEVTDEEFTVKVIGKDGKWYMLG